MKKSKIFSIVMISILLFSILFFVFDQYYISQEDLILKYEFEVNQNNFTSYEIYIPIPNIPHKIDKKEGSIEIDNFDTIHGKVYRIKASGQIKLVIKGFEERYTLFEDEIPGHYYGFSTQNDSNEDEIINWRDEYNFWIYQNQKSNISISFIIHLDSNEDGFCGTNRYIYFNGEISPGWNLTSFEEQGECWDGYPILHEYSICCIPAFIIIPIIMIIGIKTLKKKG